MTRKEKKSHRILPAILLLVITAAIARYWYIQPGYDITPGYITVEKAFHEQQSGLMVEVDGSVVRILETHADSERFQEFVIRIVSGQTVLIVNDTAKADPIPLSVGDGVTARGEYKWTENGGTIRFTYRDSSRQRRHGWIDHQGDRYQ